jgi:hypothetical protein
MTETELYQRSDEVLGPYLASKGFRAGEPGEYLRRTEFGNDRILVSRGAGNKAKTHFLVAMSYYPDYLSIVEELVPLEAEDRGFPCGPYLSPAGVMRREKYWSCKDRDVMEKNLGHVLQCLDQVGLPWLKSLRDPRLFADNVDPVAALDAGYANEVAGNIEKAIASYEEMLRRMRLVLESKVDEAYLLKRVGRSFVFVAKKLGIEGERCEWFQRKLNYYPDIKPLAPE